MNKEQSHRKEERIRLDKPVRDSSPIFGGVIWCVATIAFDGVLSKQVSWANYSVGSKVILLVFLLPFHVIALGYLHFGIKAWLGRSTLDPAGLVVDRFQNTETLRFGPKSMEKLGVALIAGAFVGNVAMPTGNGPESNMRIAVACALFLATTIAIRYFWEVRDRKGVRDLILDRNRDVISIPPTGMRNERISVRFAEIEDVGVERVESTGDDSLRYDLMLYQRDGCSIVVRERISPRECDRVVTWLRNRIGVEGRRERKIS